MNDEIGPLLARLPDPEPPATLSATVMARIAREPDRASRGAMARDLQYRDRPFRARILAGVLVVLAVTVHGWVSAGSVPDVVSWRMGLPRLVPIEGPAALLVAIGLLVYVRGLFAPLRR
jgi:hypothetical protein